MPPDSTVSTPEVSAPLYIMRSERGPGAIVLISIDFRAYSPIFFEIVRGDFLVFHAYAWIWDEFTTGTISQSQDAPGTVESRGGRLVSRILRARDPDPYVGGIAPAIGAPTHDRRKIFSAVALEEMRRDEKWLARASDCIVQYWRTRNEKKTAHREVDHDAPCEEFLKPSVSPVRSQPARRLVAAGE